MDWMTEALKSPTLRRAAMSIGGGLIIALNKKLALGLDSADVGGIVTIVVGYLLQSAAVDRQRILAEAAAAGASAAEQVKTLDDAAKVLAPAPEAKP